MIEVARGEYVDETKLIRISEGRNYTRFHFLDQSSFEVCNQDAYTQAIKDLIKHNPPSTKQS